MLVELTGVMQSLAQLRTAVAELRRAGGDITLRCSAPADVPRALELGRSLGLWGNEPPAVYGLVKLPEADKYAALKAARVWVLQPYNNVDDEFVIPLSEPDSDDDDDADANGEPPNTPKFVWRVDRTLPWMQGFVPVVASDDVAALWLWSGAWTERRGFAVVRATASSLTDLTCAEEVGDGGEVHYVSGKQSGGVVVLTSISVLAELRVCGGRA